MSLAPAVFLESLFLVRIRNPISISSVTMSSSRCGPTRRRRQGGKLVTAPKWVSRTGGRPGSHPFEIRFWQRSGAGWQVRIAWRRRWGWTFLWRKIGEVGMNGPGTEAPDGGEGLAFAYSDSVFHILDVWLASTDPGLVFSGFLPWPCITALRIPIRS